MLWCKTLDIWFLHISCTFNLRLVSRDEAIKKSRKIYRYSILCLKNQELPLLLGKNGKLKQATVVDVSRPWRFLSEKICYCWYLQQIYQSSLSNLNERNLFNISLSWMYRFSFFNPLSPAAPGDIGERASCRVRAWIKHPENSVFFEENSMNFQEI